MGRARDRYHTLDGVRGFAALIVAVHHLSRRSVGLDFSGYWTVDLFFVLSGFVIARSYGERLSAGLTAGRFMQRRLLRLYPLYAFGLAVAVVKNVFGSIVGDARTLTVLPFACDLSFGLAMLPSPCSQKVAPLNAPTWSLFSEIYVNLAFALLLWRLPRAALAAIAAAAAIWLAMAIGPPTDGKVGWLWIGIVAGIPRALFSFTAGVLIARSLRIERRTSWLAAAFPVLLVAIACLRPSDDIRKAVDLALVLVLLPLIVAAASVLDAPPLLARPFRLLGDLSYPIYIIHGSVIAMVGPLTDRAGFGPLASIMAFLLVLLPIGYALMIADARLRRWIGARLAARQSAMPRAA